MGNIVLLKGRMVRLMRGEGTAGEQEDMQLAATAIHTGSERLISSSSRGGAATFDVSEDDLARAAA